MVLAPPVPFYRAAAVGAIDRFAIERLGIPGYALMCRAGRAAFDHGRLRWPAVRRWVCVCGAGNNAGDGYVVARLARESGDAAVVLTLSDPTRLHGDAALARNDALRAGVTEQSFADADLDTDAVLVDAMLGTGLGRALEGTWREAALALAARRHRVLALDLPSGLDADTGKVWGAAVAASLTVTFIAMKPGLLTGRAAEHVGRLVLAPLDVPAAARDSEGSAGQWYRGQAGAEALAPRAACAHKGRFGHVLVVGGDHGMGGAVRLAATAAARCGSGLTSVATRERHAAVLPAAQPELMAQSVESVAALEPLLDRASVVAVGPGLGRHAWGQAMLERVLQEAKPLVLDADALNLLGNRAAPAPGWILTPHPGEASRLLGVAVADIEADRIGAAKAIAVQYRATVVLKGAGTVIASPDGQICITTTGNPGMASGGMGDVLTGVIAALRAQGLSGHLAATHGAWMHGAAADMAAADQPRGLLAGDLLPMLRRLANPGVGA